MVIKRPAKRANATLQNCLRPPSSADKVGDVPQISSRSSRRSELTSCKKRLQESPDSARSTPSSAAPTAQPSDSTANPAGPPNPPRSSNGQNTGRYGLATDSRSAHARTKHGRNTDKQPRDAHTPISGRQPRCALLISFHLDFSLCCVFCESSAARHSLTLGEFVSPWVTNPRKGRLPRRAGKSKRQKAAGKSPPATKTPSCAKPEGLK